MHTNSGSYTVFDIVGRFRVMKRLVPGAVPHTSIKEIVLVKDLNPNQAACGRTALESFMKVHECIKPHIKTEGLERQWLEDWELRSRKVKEEEEKAA